ncbi:MAG: peptidylprolyl isomerase [Clostridia bacterium]|nr:peptidylprolyl isomerase [Clostridia bacterium]
MSKKRSSFKRSRTSLIVISALVVAILGITLYNALINTNKTVQPVPFEAVDSAVFKKDTNPVATIKIKDAETPIVVELYPDAAPNTVSNFVSLANSGFYDGLTFHRVKSGFVIQGGCPDGNGSGNPGYSIKGEFAQNGVTNNLSHTRGVISMARSDKPDSAGSQFFITHAAATHLNGSYAAFGEVVSGMETVDMIASVQTGYNDKPLIDQVIEEIRVDTKGIQYNVNKIGG